MEQVTDRSGISPRREGNEPAEIERWASLIGGGALVLTGLRQGSLRGALTAIAGGGLLYQGLTHQSTIERAKEAIGAANTIKVEKTVTIDRTPAELYTFWRDFERLPTFLKHIKSITVLNDRRSRWVATAPLQDVEWEAEILKDETNHLIAWASVEGSQIDNSGFIRFQPATGDRGTEVKLVLEYSPAGGAIANTIAKLFGESPEQQIGDDLRRFKQLMEAGEIATTEGQPRCS
ncbi:SRPBCC family protein [Pannus brasiliensis CCIBt3594]|uniref:SRPBCC family protein n=1 Tax=Pannus brasiliensis CCIBt3594 TaxID=1427578 RepID=A0AAW9QX28_9CHRO